MAYKSLGTFSWGSGPVITGTFYYDKSRSGTSMKYKIKIVIDPVTGSSYFGYPIRTKIYLDGTKKASATLKDVSPNRWSDPIVYETSWITVSNKTSGTTSLIINLYSDSGSTRDTDYKKSLEVDPATSAIGKVSAFNIGDAIKVPVTKYNSNFRDNLRIYYGGESVAVRGNYKSNTAVTFTEAELEDIYSKMSTVKSGTFTFRITTYTDDSMDTSLGYDETTAKGSITGAAPTFDSSQITYKDTNTTVTAITGNNQHIVQNQSTLQVAVTAATGNKGAAIKKYEATLNGVTRSRTSAGTFDFGKIDATYDLELSVKITDSRGNTRTGKKTIAILEWKTPSASIEAKRVNNFEADGTILVNARYSSVNEKNTINISYQWKRTGSSTYSDPIVLHDGVVRNFTFNNQYAYDLKITIEDRFASKVYDIKLSKGVPIFFIDTGMLALGVGMFPTGRDGVVMELNGKLAFNGGMGFTKIWEGTCATGDTITVADILKYRFYAVRFESSDGTSSVANYVLCARYGTTYLRGLGGFPTSSAMVFYGVNFTIDGTQLTATAIAYQAMGGTYTPRTINVIYGIL